MSQTREDNFVTETTADETPVSDAEALSEVVSDSGRPRRKVRTGLVISDKMDKTVTVSVESRVKHPLYGKVVRKSSKLKAHDEANEAGVGDRVLVMETRPLSASKRWRLVRVLEKAK